MEQTLGASRYQGRGEGKTICIKHKHGHPAFERENGIRGKLAKMGFQLRREKTFLCIASLVSWTTRK